MWSVIATVCALAFITGGGLLIAGLVLWIVAAVLRIGPEVVISGRVLAIWVGVLLALLFLARAAIALDARRNS